MQGGFIKDLSSNVDVNVSTGRPSQVASGVKNNRPRNELDVFEAKQRMI